MSNTLRPALARPCEGSESAGSIRVFESNAFARKLLFIAREENRAKLGPRLGLARLKSDSQRSVE